MSAQQVQLTAVICHQGHVLTDSLESNPKFRNDLGCEVCGMEVISCCPTCQTPINGQAYSDKTYSFSKGIDMWGNSLGYNHSTRRTKHGEFVRPSYCRRCRSPYPWTQMAIDAAKNRIQEELEYLDDRNREMLIDGLNDLLVKTPKTDLTVSRFKRIINKFPDSSDILNGIVGSLATDAIKKLFGLG